MARAQFSELEKKYAKSVIYMLTGGLNSLAEKEGAQLQGITLRLEEGDCLLVIRALVGERHMVAFVGGVTGAGALHKAHTELRAGEMKWVPDKYRE